MSVPNWRAIALDTKNYNQEWRIQAAFHLENQPDDEAVHILGKGLKTDPSPIVRHEFAFSLGETAHPKIAAPYLMEAVEHDPNIFVRHEAVLALATLGKEEFISFIARFINDPEPEMAESAQIALQRIKQTGH
ncbi:HEAT repeat domain-containing protein [Candidatus Pacearchaeota archaeon]|nr:HEAT repeat domain-containing protein [Candidatus Pacearchaeota archaeon]